MQKHWHRMQILPVDASFLAIIVCFLIYFKILQKKKTSAFRQTLCRSDYQLLIENGKSYDSGFSTVATTGTHLINLCITTVYVCVSGSNNAEERFPGPSSSPTGPSLRELQGLQKKA